MCLTSCNTFQKHLLSQKENLIFWPQKWIFEISEAIFDSFWHPNMRKRHCKATLKVSKNFWDLQSKIGSMRLFQMFRGLIWYHSRGHTTKIDFGKRSRLKKKQKLPRDQPFEIIGFKCWPKFLHEIKVQTSSYKTLFSFFSYLSSFLKYFSFSGYRFLKWFIVNKIS